MPYTIHMCVTLQVNMHTLSVHVHCSGGHPCECLPGFTGTISDGITTDNFVWFDSGYTWLNSDALPGNTLTGAESSCGIGDLMEFLYSPSTDGSDSVWSQNGLVLEEVTGRRFLSVPTSGAFMRGIGRFMDKLGDHAPSSVPMSEESMGYATQWVKMDNSKAENELGLVFRPLAESLRDTIEWLYQAGHISGKQAGLLAEE